jgi:hypothetical protein
MAEEAPFELVPLRGASNELGLRKPSWRKGLYELRAGEVVVGLLDVKAWSGASRARTAAGDWRIDRPRGFAQRRIRVLTPDGGEELATVDRDWTGRRATLRLDGDRYELRAHGWWKPRWVWTGDGGDLAALTTRETFREEKGRVTLTPAGEASPHADLLVLLGAHLALLSAREQAAAAG